jgi:hypothetical protein
VAAVKDFLAATSCGNAVVMWRQLAAIELGLAALGGNVAV